ncbi:hypothetical protein LXL04_020747 [Taraxacum kok-saghyz]
MDAPAIAGAKRERWVIVDGDGERRTEGLEEDRSRRSKFVPRRGRADVSLSAGFRKTNICESLMSARYLRGADISGQKKKKKKSKLNWTYLCEIGEVEEEEVEAEIESDIPVLACEGRRLEEEEVEAERKGQERWTLPHFCYGFKKVKSQCSIVFLSPAKHGKVIETRYETEKDKGMNSKR